MRAKSKIWIEKDNKLIFGEGKSEIFKLIQSYGSINRAAERIGFSYRRAWSYVSEIEKRLGIKLIERTKGGSSGGGSRLTDDAIRLMERYDRFKKKVDRYTDLKFAEYFSEWKDTKSLK